MRFNLKLEYQKGQDNTVADALTQITTHLGPKAVHSVLDGVTLGMAHRAEGHDPMVVLNAVLNWLETQKEED